MALSASGLKVGDVHTARLVEDLKRTQIVQYAGASGDYNPLHTDEIFTTKVAGYPSVFAHGMLTMGMTGKMLTDYVGDARLTKYGVRFTSQVWPGDTLDSTAVIMAAGGEVITYGELERRSNRLAHYLRRLGLQRLDHYSIFMENHARYVECCAAGERAGLYYTCINSYLQPEEVAYLLEN